MPTPHTLTIPYALYPHAEALPPELGALVAQARRALDTSYSPYSHFAVGAAVRLANGAVVLGSNQENGAYPSGMCAERVALFSAGVQHAGVAVVAIALVARYEGRVVASPLAPCGACRQVMLESQGRGQQPMRVVMVGSERIVVLDDVGHLLPFGFQDPGRASH